MALLWHLPIIEELLFVMGKKFRFDVATPRNKRQ